MLDGCCRTSRMWCWSGRLAHVLLAHFADLERETLFVGKDVAVLHLEFGGVLRGGKHAALLEQFHDESSALFEHLAMALFNATGGGAAAVVAAVGRCTRSSAARARFVSGLWRSR